MATATMPGGMVTQETLWTAEPHSDGRVKLCYGDTCRLVDRQEAIAFGRSILDCAGWQGIVGGETSLSRAAAPLNSSPTTTPKVTAPPAKGTKKGGKKC